MWSYKKRLYAKLWEEIICEVIRRDYMWSYKRLYVMWSYKKRLYVKL